MDLFFQVEAQFNNNRIISGETKSNYLVSQLEPKYVENIWDMVASYSVTKYSESKARLLDFFKGSERSGIKKKNINEIDLGNLKPNQLLQKLKSGNSCVTNKLNVKY